MIQTSDQDRPRTQDVVKVNRVPLCLSDDCQLYNLLQLLRMADEFLSLRIPSQPFARKLIFEVARNHRILRRPFVRHGSHPKY